MICMNETTVPSYLLMSNALLRGGQKGKFGVALPELR